VKQSFLILTLGLMIFTACSKKAEDTSNVIPKELNQQINPKIQLPEVSSDGCLNLEKLMARMQAPGFHFPALRMTTHMRSLTAASSDKIKYLAHSNFYYRSSPANRLIPFTTVTQPNCQTLQMTTASNQKLTYKITEATSTRLKFELTQDKPAEIPKFQQEALLKRIQPYEFDVQYISENNLKVVEKFKMIDSLCQKKKFDDKLETTQVYFWASSTEELPQQLEVDSGFLVEVLSSLKNPITVAQQPLLTVSEIKQIMTTPIMDELKRCGL